MIRLPVRRMTRLLVVIGTVALLTGPARCGHILNSTHTQVLSSWLAKHPEYRAAADADCTCDEEIHEMRTQGAGVWKPAPGYHPYVVTGDFNGDGATDFAVVATTRATPDPRFAVLIFNGLFKTGAARPAFIQSGLDLRHNGLSYGPPRPRPYRLVLGRFESEGAVFIPHGDTYRLDSP